ncbi:uroporphyrinogen decarboxylase [Fontimonas thermophila]|uniref:Uroporphyrinogen decarboxylase n=1 Tax=Fontimonas thermophila TaxID=1076937 RepID=A0A1I2H692_9GAMM|nr:uroporphyrinogen decarboxylase [Fontimonas thermophila]SFF25704.1 uroporphyrinogen decarboxylase [Fontimonas thermophila]
MRPIENDRLLRALRREPVDRTPVWMMRQAGRYLPEYRASRAKAGDFMSLCRNPELCCEVTLQPIARYDLDAAILFSDILTVPDAMGLGLRFVEHEGPVFDRPVRDAQAIEALPVPDPETELRYVMDAVRTIRAALGTRLPLIGFAGSPWTLATYMVEGGGGSDFTQIKQMAYAAPETLEHLLAKLTAAVSLYLEAQVRAGADALMLFDTWGGVLAPADYRRFSLEPMARIVAHLKRVAAQVPVILFTKNGGAHLEVMAETGCDALGLDWTTDLAAARARVGDRVALQGNLDPAWLLAPPARIEAAVARVLASYGSGPGHVFNLGHGILQQTPPEHAAVMVEAVRALSPAYHRRS